MGKGCDYSVLEKIPSPEAEREQYTISGFGKGQKSAAEDHWTSAVRSCGSNPHCRAVSRSLLSQAHTHRESGAMMITKALLHSFPVFVFGFIFRYCLWS